MGYRGVHNWVERKLGKPKTCSECEDNTKTYYEWANISGNYLRELSDWKRLCASCHRKYDYIPKTSCVRGHEYNEANTRIRITKTGTARVCRLCQKVHNNNYKMKRINNYEQN